MSKIKTIISCIIIVSLSLTTFSNTAFAFLLYQQEQLSEQDSDLEQDVLDILLQQDSDLEQDVLDILLQQDSDLEQDVLDVLLQQEVYLMQNELPPYSHYSRRTSLKQRKHYLIHVPHNYTKKQSQRLLESIRSYRERLQNPRFFEIVEELENMNWRRQNQHFHELWEELTEIVMREIRI